MSDLGDRLRGLELDRAGGRQHEEADRSDGERALGDREPVWTSPPDGANLILPSAVVVPSMTD